MNIPLTENAKNEIKAKLNSKSNIIGPNGKFIFSADTLIPRRAILSLTGPVLE